jgi:hypothetical protein
LVIALNQTRSILSSLVINSQQSLALAEHPIGLTTDERHTDFVPLSGAHKDYGADGFNLSEHPLQPLTADQS